jgi:hypothetical protein
LALTVPSTTEPGLTLESDGADLPARTLARVPWAAAALCPAPLDLEPGVLGLRVCGAALAPRSPRPNFPLRGVN